MIIVDAHSPNSGPRREDKKIRFLILHYTGTASAAEALKLLQGSDPQHQVSAHYLVDTDGKITRIVEESLRAWHAGKSSFEGETDINSCSIGIEIQNPGHEYGYVSFPDEQMNAVRELCLDILRRHDISPCHVLAHSDIAPDRKADPGELFPWEWLAENSCGTWPDITDQDRAKAGEIRLGEADIKALLERYGYDTSGSFKNLVTAFQRHFEPAIFQHPEKAGIPSLDTVSCLLALIRQKQASKRKIS